MSTDCSELWKKRDRGGESVREQIITRYAYLARYAVDRLNFPSYGAAGYDDLIGHAIIGLIDAVDKFEPARGIKFETYAIPRIRGAVIDALRVLDWVPRSVRKHESELRDAYARAEAALCGAASDQDVADQLGIGVSGLHEKLALVGQASLLSLDEALAAGFDYEEAFPHSEPAQDIPYMEAQRTEQAQLLADAIDQLPERERTVIALYYAEGLTLKEIAQVLGVTESRVCQLHSKATLRLNGKLAGCAEVFAPAA